jgi:1,2-diacylglycerol 3-beta-glucosyltransferase
VSAAEIGYFGAQALANAVSLGVLLHGSWWTTLSLVALRRPATAPRRDRSGIRMAVLIPAHNEEASISGCVSSVRRSAAARGGETRIVVVADNCTDATARLAQAEGAIVIERVDQRLTGKPHALEAGLAWLARSDPPEVVVFVDGDCEVEEGLLPALASRFNGDAQAVQAHYATLDGGTSLQRLRTLALMLVHWSRPLGGERLGIGTTIKGSGMALRWPLVEQGFGAHGIAEDAELTLSLCERGVRVDFEPSAVVRGPMAATYAAARTQDRRWEAGRSALAPRAIPTAWKSLVRGRPGRALTALDVAALPLTPLVIMSASALALSLAGVGSGLLATLAATSLGTYLVVGLAAARPSLRDLSGLLAAPRFIVHKSVVMFEVARGRGPTTWERTDRTQPPR